MKRKRKIVIPRNTSHHFYGKVLYFELLTESLWFLTSVNGEEYDDHDGIYLIDQYLRDLQAEDITDKYDKIRSFI